MTPFAAPVSMIVPGKGGALAAGVIALLLVLAFAARRDPTATQTTPQR